MASNETIKKTLSVTIILSLVCSILVSTAAVVLKQRQEDNKQIDMRRNILMISGIVDDASTLTHDEIDKAFESIVPKIVDFDKGTFYNGEDLDINKYEQRTAAKDPNQSKPLPTSQDLASIKRRADFSKIFVIEKNNTIETIILPVHGYGLWSTMYGFIALQGDLKTVVGMGFYEHAETPGLGGEVDNPRWKAQWKGKQVLNDNGIPNLQVIKGTVDPNSRNATHQVDGLSGASLTSRGVQNLINFWMGDKGFGPFLANLKKGAA